MKVLLNVPSKEFGNDLIDKFQDFFTRIKCEISRRLMHNEELLCGAYEIETGEMFLSSFKEATYIPDNATNYDVLKAIFGNTTAFLIKDRMEFEKGFVGWFNAPYNL